MVACSTYPEKFIRDNVVAPFLQLSVVIVTLPDGKLGISTSTYNFRKRIGDDHVRNCF